MTCKEKAREILEKVNNGKISKPLWKNCSDYAREDLRRKAFIVVDEIIHFMDLYDIDITHKHQFDWWKKVRAEIEAF